MTHLLIIDALNLIRRLHAAPGQPIDPTAALQSTAKRLEGTVNILLREAKPSHVLAVFDAEQPGWRHACYPAYKQGRNPMPQALSSGMPMLQHVLRQCGVDSLLSAEDEADDLIATLAGHLTRRAQPVPLISTDKGFCQLLPTGLQIRDYFNRRWLDAAFVEQQYGVAPSQLVDFWALTGISGSHIPGVSGVGPKGAGRLLQRYGSLTQVLVQDPAQPDPVSGQAPDPLLAKVQASADDALLAQRLVRLRDDIPLGFNLKDIRYIPAVPM